MCPKISVIVPVYKVEKYLGRCVDSILAQTYENFELILVDDGSPDRCGVMCEEYAEKDGRIQVLHRENGGLSAARNTGIDWVFTNSGSEYITFIDSDDWVHPQYLELLLRAAEENGVGVSVARHRYKETYDRADLTRVDEEPKVETMMAEDLLVNHEWFFNYAWNKLYARGHFETLRYPVGKNFEDTFTTYQALFESGQVALVDQELYFYFRNMEGITRSPWSPKELVVFEGIRQQLAFYKEHGYERAYEKEEWLYLNHYAYQICRIRENKGDLKKNRSYLVQLRKEMKTLIRQSSGKYSRAHMPQCYEAAHPILTGVPKLLERGKNAWKRYGFVGLVKRLKEKV